ncbi:MAG: hypothetical protein MJ193_05660 [Clostridia bacterium]|nr:hypothetical protein [Clostridia bacterium]
MEQQIAYKYSRIGLEQFAIFEENFVASDKEIQFQTEIQFSFDAYTNMFSSKVVVSAFQLDKPILKACLDSYFEISAESIGVLRKDGKIAFSPALLVQFSSFCYGAMRGVIFSKTQDTPLNTIVLPPIYLDRIIDRSFEISER